MKPKKIIKVVFINVFVVSLTSLFLISCDWIIHKKNQNSDIFEVDKTGINTNKNEAKLLVMASQNNLDIIDLCQNIKGAETEKNIKHLAEDLEKTSIKIYKDYKALAQEELISIPQYSTVHFQLVNNTFKEGEDTEFIEENLELIIDKLNNQIELLKKLSETTNNKEFKSLSKKTNSVLKLKLDKTEDTLNKFETL